MELLGSIEEVLLVYPPRPSETRPRTAICLSERDVEQEQLFNALELARYQHKEVG